jgi:phosphotransferase system HPr (HPr) family protein
VTAQKVKVVNTLGLHARAAAKFVGVAARFQSQIRVTRGQRTMDGKSILGLLLLAAARGSELTITAEGPDEADAIAALVSLVERGFEDA